MPNWCDNDLTISGPTLRVHECLAAIKNDEDVIDFEKIIPMPPILKDTKSPTDWRIHYILKIPDSFHGESLIRRTMEEEGVTDEEAFKDHLLSKYSVLKSEYDQVKIALEQTGSCNWYDWSIEHWGTKWNGHGRSVDVQTWGEYSEAELNFDTAWSPPLPVIKALGEKYPDLSFTLVYYESGGAFHGRFCMKKGKQEVNECSKYYGNRGG